MMEEVVKLVPVLIVLGGLCLMLCVGEGVMWLVEKVPAFRRWKERQLRQCPAMQDGESDCDEDTVEWIEAVEWVDDLSKEEWYEA